MSTSTIPLMIALITCPALLATNEAIRQGQSKDRKEQHRARRCNLIISCMAPSPRSREIDRREVALKNSKLYINVANESNPGHPFAGYYLPYPDTAYEGLVSSITSAAPIMNWIYIDQSTYEVKYGVRADAQPNFTGPFDCTKQDRRLLLEGWEGFLAVEEGNEWALYFDRDDNGSKDKVSRDRMVLEVQLCSQEKRVGKGSE